MTTTTKRKKGPTANLGSGKQWGNPILSYEARKERGEHRQWHSWSETLGAYQAWAPQQVVRVRRSSTAPLNPLSARLLFLPLTPRCDEVITNAAWLSGRFKKHCGIYRTPIYLHERSAICPMPLHMEKKESRTLVFFWERIKRKHNSKPHRNLFLKERKFEGKA